MNQSFEQRFRFKLIRLVSKRYNFIVKSLHFHNGLLKWKYRITFFNDALHCNILRSYLTVQVFNSSYKNNIERFNNFLFDSVWTLMVCRLKCFVNDCPRTSQQLSPAVRFSNNKEFNTSFRSIFFQVGRTRRSVWL